MILCCGEALIDMIPAPTELGRDGFVPFVGGAVFNTAIALGRLGVDVGMLTGLSNDMFGQQLQQALIDSKVDTSLVSHSDRPTTLAFVTLTNGQASYAFYDENTAGRMLQPAEVPDVPATVSAFYFGGISLACEPAADAYATLLKSHGQGRAVMMDPNIRANFIQDETRYRARLDDMMAYCDILKVSDEDLNWLVQTTGTLADKAHVLMEKGPTVVIVTRGGDGASAYFAEGSVDVPSQRVEIVDTVGAGDTFNAGVLAKLSALNVLSPAALATPNPADLEAALHNGARIAAINVSRAGVNPPWASELE
ncbi:carbohydrate kinase [Epibacterium ulvae]|uniref:carbohydrate kinase family protein n=1 Tax=Epibacterium ulvae TaxID=1156985 RepID=UPI001BFC5F5E|nr:carbohydrate kinase [Epibacterium ulvae]MBT8153659.1 carbohydrate kinase [Epibacterium ulvae]